MTLTDKQQEVLDFIIKFRDEQGYAPTVGDIMRGLGYNSVSAAKVHVTALIRKGKIKTTPNVARSIVVL